MADSEITVLLCDSSQVATKPQTCNTAQFTACPKPQLMGTVVAGRACAVKMMRTTEAEALATQMSGFISLILNKTRNMAGF